MELFLNATSPYARMARIVVLEKGLGDSVTLRWCDPWNDDAELLKANPAGRIPALVTDDGTPLSESLLIAIYLDRCGKGETIIPPSRFSDVLHQAGLGQNLMDAAFNTVIARKHYGAEIDQSELGQRRLRAIHRLLERLEAETNGVAQTDSVSLGDIAIGVALAYLEFRLPEMSWQGLCPELSAWYGAISSRKSFESTSF